MKYFITFLLFYSTISIAKDDIFLIDINYIVNNLPDNAKIQDYVSKLKQKEMNKIEYIQKEIESKQKIFKNSKTILSIDGFKQLEKEIAELNQMYIYKMEEINYQLIKVEEEQKTPISRQVILKAQELCIEFECSLVIEKSSIVIYQNKTVKDISPLIIKEFTKKIN